MDVVAVLKEYDSMFLSSTLSDIEDYLYQKICEAVEEQDDGAIITLLNEMIGFCRDTSQKDKALAYCEQLKKMLERMNLKGTEHYATSMQNIANAYRAFALFEEALEAFGQIEKTYEQYLAPNDILWATLYNNWGLLYQEKEDYVQSVQILQKALELILQQKDCEIKVATTKTNLANSLFLLQDEKSLATGYQYVREALDIYVQDGERDFHYGAALTAMGDYYMITGKWKSAKEFYEKGIVEIIRHTGKSDGYTRVLNKWKHVYHILQEEEQSLHPSNLDKSLEFYEKYGANMISDQFPAYASRIAVGMVGEGSDCFGYDDVISQDHDYQIGFCMWLTDEDYEKIGETLQNAYDELLNEHNIVSSPRQRLRRGVMRINDFYVDATGESSLSCMVNGAVFRDDLGIFSQKRKKLLQYYPQSVWRQKLATLLHDFSQFGQSNYPRMMAREDYVTASLCLHKTMECAMDIAYILMKSYAPYYKWKKQGLLKNQFLPELLFICEELVKLPIQKTAWEHTTYDATRVNYQDKAVCLVEQLAYVLLEEMKAQHLLSGNDLFLELYVETILKGENMSENLVDKIVELEWEQFDHVKNEGGRASCQDDYGTFSIMRKSQYLAWNEELLKSYYQDLSDAHKRGWNLITEKYARMMESTVPEKYMELADKLPVRSKERQVIAEEIIKIQVDWMEGFAKEYPQMAQNARSIHTEQDNEYNTSYETYLRGELGTYSEETFVLYGHFIAGLCQEGKNLAYEIMQNTAFLYGYDSLESAEKSLQ